MKLFLLLFFILAVLAGIDPYEVLGISRDADEKTIKSAYRQLSKKYHPDKNSEEGAHEKFIEIGEAYDILNDPQKKANYDRFGDADGQQGGQFDFGDIVNQFFGGHGGQRRGGGKPRGGDTKTHLAASLVDFYRGKELPFSVQMSNICDTCEGTGSKDKQTHKCSQCQGSGRIQVRRQFGPGMFQTMQMQCDVCGGKGTTIASPCSQCGGHGAKPTQRSYTVSLKPGFQRDHQVVLEGEGEQNPDWLPGNLIVELTENLLQSWGYRRVGNNLYRTEVLTVKEAVKGGWQRSIAFFDEFEPEVNVSRPKGKVVIDGEVEVIKGKGMPIIEENGEHDEAYGDLYIEYRVLMTSSPGFVADEL